MLSAMKAGLVLAAGFTGAAMLCPLCGEGAGAAAAATPPGVYGLAADTAQVRLHISGMTCGSCPTTARLALRKLTGVYQATVTLDDSLGVVQYDPRRVTPAEIAAHLKRLTGYVATVLPDGTATQRWSGDA
jgi:mercuric ion binding protein